MAQAGRFIRRPEFSASKAYFDSISPTSRGSPMSPNIGPLLLPAGSVTRLLALSHCQKWSKRGEAMFCKAKCQSEGVYSVAAKIQVDGTLKPSADAKIATLPITRRRRSSPTTKCGWTMAKRPTAGQSATTMRRQRPSKWTSTATPPRLREDMRLIAVKSGKAGVSISSPHGPLTREELDLIDLPGNTLLLDGLLPDEKVKIGGSWKIADAALGQIGLRRCRQPQRSDVRIQRCERFRGGNKDRRPAQCGRRRRRHGNPSRRQRRPSIWHKHCLTSIQLRIKERRSVGYVAPGHGRDGSAEPSNRAARPVRSN